MEKGFMKNKSGFGYKQCKRGFCTIKDILWEDLIKTIRGKSSQLTLELKKQKQWLYFMQLNSKQQTKNKITYILDAQMDGQMDELINGWLDV